MAKNPTKNEAIIFTRLTKEEKARIVKTQKHKNFHSLAEYVRITMLKDAASEAT